MPARSLNNLAWLTARQQKRLRAAMVLSTVEKRGIIFDEKHSPDSAYILVSGVARITCRNRKGLRTLVIMVAPGMIPGFPPPVKGISYSFRCEAVTSCEVGGIALDKLIEISLGIGSDEFKRMSSSYVGRWDMVQLRCSNFMSCTLEERLALILLELGENFGVVEGPGTRLTIAARHKDIADMVGASRPRITEYLLEFERKRLISHLKRRFLIRRDKLEAFLAQRHPMLKLAR